MMIKYNIDIANDTVAANLKRIINQIYKLLPMREEGVEWTKPLSTIMEELAGMSRLFIGQQSEFLTLLSKMEGLYTCTQKQDFMSYRRTIFQCLSILNELERYINVGA